MRLGVQRGGALSTLVILLVLAFIGYYVYKQFLTSDEVPSCKAVLQGCMKDCRRTTTEAPAAQACQDACQRDVEACERKR
jgi:Tfp pilus assembly protein PilE